MTVRHGASNPTMKQYEGSFLKKKSMTYAWSHTYAETHMHTHIVHTDSHIHTCAHKLFFVGHTIRKYSPTHLTGETLDSGFPKMGQSARP